MIGKMQKGRQTTAQAKASWKVLLENLFVVALAFYPLRHVGWGLDLNDTGYNYANFEYMGTEHMDPMWLFSTYLSNAVGHFLTGLPGGDTLRGMNLYTGLFVSLLALTGFFFCTRVLKMPSWLGFVGEMLALSLCWCPTAKLYDYLTYVLLTFCAILLYLGLVREKKWYLFGAGVCLGLNVLVRFSNLPQAALILAVWGYDGALEREMKRLGIQKKPEPFFARLGRHTLWCLYGYGAALGALLFYLHLTYGIGAYIQGILRLFAMTDTATDYKAASMALGMVRIYWENLYWVVRIGVLLAGGTALFALLSWLWGRRDGGKTAPWEKALAVLLGAAMLVWLYGRKFCSLLFFSYDPILRPGILFLMLAMLCALIAILHPWAPREEKLIAGIVFLLVLLTSIGSNNGIYPSLNNLFLAGPYTLWQCQRFLKGARERTFWSVRISPLPAKALLSAFLLMCLFQFGAFGAVFVFAESTGVQQADSYVENNAVLQGVRMSADKAGWMTQLSAYVEEQDLKGREVILYGDIPSLSFYLQMPSAFNPWSSLPSYSAGQMEEELRKTASSMAADQTARPVVIVEQVYMAYRTGGREALERQGLGEGQIQKIEGDAKWVMLDEFLRENGYRQELANGKCTVFR